MKERVLISHSHGYLAGTIQSTSRYRSGACVRLCRAWRTRSCAALADTHQKAGWCHFLVLRRHRHLRQAARRSTMMLLLPPTKITFFSCAVLIAPIRAGQRVFRLMRQSTKLVFVARRLPAPRSRLAAGRGALPTQFQTRFSTSRRRFMDISGFSAIFIFSAISVSRHQHVSQLFVGAGRWLISFKEELGEHTWPKLADSSLLPL